MTLADVLFLLLSAVPVPTTPGAPETRAEQLVRLRSIADDVAAVSESAGDATLLLATAYHESALSRDVDVGPCWRGKEGNGPQCDNGTAASMWQIHGGARNASLFANRREAARVALAALKSSSATCRKLPRAEQFTAYASGGCSSEAGKRGSRELYAAWSSWAQKYRVELARAGEKRP